MSPETIRSVAPALERYTHDRLLGEVWKRPGLSARDRSIVTLAVLIARTQTLEMPYYMNLALDNGVKPSEISEMITHLAFYSGWGNAMSAVPLANEVFGRRGIKVDDLARTSQICLPSTKPPRQSAPPMLNSNSALWHPACCITRRRFSSESCGCVRRSNHEIEAL